LPCYIEAERSGAQRRQSCSKKTLSGKVRGGDGSKPKGEPVAASTWVQRLRGWGPSLLAGSAIELCAGLFQVLMSCVTQETNQRPDYKCFAACMVILRLFGV
jgi:hypothetical protein